MPDVIKAALNIEKYGSHGITVHPRPDGRHIRRDDVFELKKVLSTEFNIEGYPTETFLQMVCQVKPSQVTLVPDAHDALTSNQGWDAVHQLGFLTEVVKELQKNGIRTSIFVETDLKNIEYAAKTGTDRIELYTGPYAHAYTLNPDKAVAPFVEAANLAAQYGLGVNSGHDLNLQNLEHFKRHISQLAEVSIGHALISDALYYGLEKTIQMYLNCLK
jgi:pyridoxine 5-phosphate synthase